MTQEITLDKELKAIDTAYAAFIAECKANGWENEYEAYKNESKWTQEMFDTYDNWIDALHDYYGKRDGDKGFLGGRGL